MVYTKPVGSTIQLHNLFVLWVCFVAYLKGEIWSALLIRWCTRKASFFIETSLMHTQLNISKKVIEIGDSKW